MHFVLKCFIALDVNECDDDSLNDCEGGCVNTIGSYCCTCPDGYIVNDGACDGRSFHPFNCDGT
jgi:hypothetical protein